MQIEEKKQWIKQKNKDDSSQPQDTEEYIWKITSLSNWDSKGETSTQ